MLAGDYLRGLVEHPHVAADLPQDFLRECRDAYEPIDFIGLNYYTPSVIGYESGAFLDSQQAEPCAAQSDYGFVNYPPGLFDSVLSVTQRYSRPNIYITENGLAHDSERPDRNLIEDGDRIAYIREHLREANRCIKAGADVRGYYYWSLMDTFESTRGYRYRFGLVQIEYDTLQRTRRKSWFYYQRCIAENAVE